MPLPIVEQKDMGPFFRTYRTTTMIPNTIASVPQPDKGTIIRQAINQIDGSTFRNIVYDFINDRVQWYTLARTTSPSSQGFRAGLILFDPLILNASDARNNWRQGQDIGFSVPYPNLRRYTAGQPRLENSTQRCFVEYTNSEMADWDWDTMSLVGADIFPNCGEGLAGSFSRSFEPTSTVAGFYTADQLNDETNLVIFDGITDSTGMGDVSLGGSSHALGLALVKTIGLNLTGTNSHGGAWAWVDLDTGNAVGFFDVPALVDNGSTPVSEPLIDGQSFEWRWAQFVPDPDSLFGQPKGEIHFMTTEGDGRVAGDPIAETGGGSRRHYVAVHDFNPFGLTTGVLRTHGFRNFLGIIDLPTTPIISGGQNLTVSEESGGILYHQPSRTYITFQGTSDNVADGTDRPIDGDWVMTRFRRTFVPDIVLSVNPVQEVTENAQIQIRSVVLTDLSQPAGGVAVSVQLRRVSTRAETFDGAALGAGVYVVAAGEIDDNGTLDVREGADVDGGGTLLALGVDYSVNYGTGTLTPIGSWPADDIFVRYRHFDVPLTPAHGTLVTAQTTTDEDGAAFIIVTYGDNLDGEFDRCDVTTL